MTLGQALNGWGSAIGALSGLSFIVSYTILARWYKSTDGRVMMAFGATLTLTYTITVILTLNNFTTGVDFMRIVQAILSTSIGICFLFYTVRMWRMQRGRGKAKR